MRSAIILVMALVSFQSFAGVGGGGVGPRPTMMFRQNVDLVRTLDINNGKVTFLYKAFDGREIEKKTAEIAEVDDLYLNAIIDSQRSKEWTTVTF